MVDDRHVPGRRLRRPFYITYDYELDGDRLTIDMLSNEYPTSDPAELAGEQIAQTVIYESAPFEKAP